MKVPYHSQHAEDVEEVWRPRACGIASLRMALEALGSTVDSTQELIEHGLKLGAYIQGVGWKHQGLVELAEARGASAYRREFKKWWWKVHPYFVRRELAAALKRGEVPIISVTVEGKTDTHLVPLVGYDKSGFYFHEPAAHSATEGANKKISFKDFTARFRNLAIFIK